MQTLFKLSINKCLKNNLFQRLPKYLQYISYYECPETFIKHHDMYAINYYIKHNILEHNNKPLLSYCLKHDFIDGFNLLHEVKCLCNEEVAEYYSFKYKDYLLSCEKFKKAYNSILFYNYETLLALLSGLGGIGFTS